MRVEKKNIEQSKEFHLFFKSKGFVLVVVKNSVVQFFFMVVEFFCDGIGLINRTGVARAVLQTALSFIYWFVN